MKNIFAASVGVAAFIFFIAFAGSARAATTTISSCAQLNSISPSVTSSYQLINNINCSGYSFSPIANFHGTLEGDGFTVSNLNVFSTNNTGIFRSLTNAIIRNITFTNLNVSGNFIVGGLSASTASTTISNVSLQGTIHSGALISIVGGLIGVTDSSTIMNSHAAMNVSGYSYAGGLVGHLSNSSIVSSSYATGNVSINNDSGNSHAGGLVGQLTSSTIENSYATGAVSGTGDYVGGLVGGNEPTSTIDRSYSVGSVSGVGTNVGGLVGWYDTSTATTTNSYWDTQTSGKATSAGGMGTTTVNMQTQGTFSGWDFTSVWSIAVSSYPILRAFDVTAPSVPGTPTSTSPTTNTLPTVTWTASTDGGIGLASLPYLVQWSTSSNFSGTVFSSSTGATSFTSSSAFADGSWYFHVQAHDLSGNTSAFSTSSAIVIDTTAPTTPGVPTSTAFTSNTLPTVTWTASTDAGAGLSLTAPYDVQWSTSSDFSGTIFASTTVTASLAPTTTLSEGIWYFRVRSRDALNQTSSFVTSTGLTIDATAPIITLLGDSTFTITQGETYTDAGVLATDTVSGNLTSSVVTTSTVSTTILGTYTLTYTVSDAAGNAATPVTRTVVVRSSPVIGVGAGGGTTVGNTSPIPLLPVASLALPPTPLLVPTALPPAPVFMPTFTESTAPLNTSARYVFTRNLRQGMRGNDVRELQKYLNTHGFTVETTGPGAPGQESTFFGSSTAAAVIRLQERNPEAILKPLNLTVGTGHVMELTRKFMNSNF